jgi:hypothetical protein
MLIRLLMPQTTEAQRQRALNIFYFPIFDLSIAIDASLQMHKSQIED